jgi:hypothetical protein
MMTAATIPNRQQAVDQLFIDLRQVIDEADDELTLGERDEEGDHDPMMTDAEFQSVVRDALRLLVRERFSA